jgi:hypothetical protein
MTLLGPGKSFGFTILGFGNSFAENGGMFIYINSLEIVMEKGVLALRLMVFLGVVLALAGSVLAVPQTFSIHGKLSDSGGPLEGTYSMNFSIYASYSGGAFLWTDTYSVTTNNLGVYDVILTDLDLPFSVQYYLGVNVAGDGEMVPRMNLTSSGYSFRANVSDYLDSARNYEVANLTLGQKLSFAFGEVVDNIVNGWVRVTGGLNVTGNVEVGGNLSMGSGYIHDLANGTAAQDAVTYSQLLGINATVSGDYVPYTGADSNLVFGDNNLSVGGSDLFVDNNNGRVGIGTGAPQSILHIDGTEGSLAGGLSFGDGDSGIYEISDDNFRIQTGGTIRMFIGNTNTGVLTSAASAGFGIVNENTAATNPVFLPEKSDIDTGLGGDGSNTLSLITGGTSRLYINSSGNVGIGTTTPGYKLEVVEGTADDGIALTWGNSVGRFTMASAEAQVHLLNSAGTKTVQIASHSAHNTYFNAGNVGIGTTSPTSKLHINGSVVINGTLDMDSGKINNLANGTAAQDAVTYSQLLGINATVSGDYVPYTGADSNLVLGDNNFSVGGSDLFVDGDLGRVGIGTGAPTEALTVSGDTSVSGNLFINGDIGIGGDSGEGEWYMMDNGTSTFRIGSTSTGRKVQMELYHSVNPVSLGVSYSGGAAFAYIESVHNSYDTNTHLLFKPGGTETWRVGSHGTSGTYSSSFEITPASDSNDFYVSNNAGTPIFYIDSSSTNVGIGTTSPGAGLHISSNSDTDANWLILEDTDTTAGSVVPKIEFKNSSAVVGTVRGHDTRGLQFGGGTGTQHMTIDRSGNVGIGTTDPGYALDIVRNADEQLRVGRSASKYVAVRDDVLLFHGMTANGMRIQTDDASDIHLRTNGADAMTIKDGGNVGIGTTTPTHELNVVGGMNVTSPQVSMFTEGTALVIAG